MTTPISISLEYFQENFDLIMDYVIMYKFTHIITQNDKPIAVLVPMKDYTALANPPG